MKKRLVIIGIIILIGVAAFLMYHFSKKTEESVLFLSGNVEVTELNLGFKLSGRVVDLLIEEGQKVKEGDRLAVLDRAELENQVAQNRAYLSETMVRFEELKAGSRPQELEQAKANVMHAEAEIIKAKKDYLRAEALYKNDAISAQQMDTAKRAYDIAASQHRIALEALILQRIL
ncbi:MAG: biotin/lipoyl-binding protein [Nitrospirota bacterium]